MSLVFVKLDWNAKPWTDEVRKIVEGIMKDGAEWTAEMAKRNLERMAPDSTGTLASQIDIRTSPYKDGGYLVEAQGSGNYTTVQRKTPVYRWNPGRKTKHIVTTRSRFYASFVELGTSKMEGLAYLRKALRRNRYRMRAQLRSAIGELRNE